MIFFQIKPIAHEEIHRALLSLGFVRISDPPLTFTQKQSRWKKSDSEVLLTTNINDGLAALSCDEALLASLASFDWKSPGEIFSILSTQSPFVEASFLLSMGKHEGVTKEPIIERLRALSKHAEDAVRHEALRSMMGLLWSDFAADIQALSQGELSWVASYWQRQQDAKTKEKEKADADKAAEEKLKRLELLLQESRFQEVGEIAREFIDSPYKDEQCTAFHALSAAALSVGNYLQAISWAAAWISNVARGQKLEVEAHLRQIGTSMQSPLSLDLKALEEAKQYTDEGAIGESLDVALNASSAKHPELVLASALFLQMSFADTEKVRSLLEVLCKGSASARVWMAYALSLEDNKSKAEAAYREALRLIEMGASDALDKIAETLEKTKAPTVNTVYERLRGLYESEYAELYRVSKEELARSPDSTGAMRSLALSCTFTYRHDEAIEAYKSAIKRREEANLSKDALLFFNLACELAKRGDTEDALVALQSASDLDDTVAKRASDDDYFARLWDDPRFFAASVSSRDGVPTVEEVRLHILRAMGRFYRGEPEEALEEGHQAIAGAVRVKDDALLSRALMVLGNVTTYTKTPERGIALLSRAASLADSTPDVAPSDRAEAHHMLGAAYHAARRFEEARRCYEAARQMRVEHLGARAPLLAKSDGDLSRLALDQGDYTLAKDLLAGALALLKEVLPGMKNNTEQLEILSDLSLLTANQVSLFHEMNQGSAAIIAAAEDTVLWLSHMEKLDGSMPGGLIGGLRRVLAPLMKTELTDDLVKRLNAIVVRLSEFEEPNEAVREEKRYWLGLELGVLSLREQGVSDQEIAEAMRLAIRGEPPKDPVGSHPAFQGLSVEFARRLTQKGDLVMIAMSIDLAIAGATSVIEAIRTLRDFAVDQVRADHPDDDFDDDDENNEFDDADEDDYSDDDFK